MNEFQGKVALVTGGTSGIGRAAAIAYAKEGAKVVVAGRRAAEGEETVRLVRAQGREALFVPTDVAQEAQVKNLVGRTLEQFGRLDFAFNNAGIEQAPTPFLEQTVETYDQVMDINVKGVWLSMRHEIPAMLKSGGGAIVNTSSAAGVIAFPGIEVYAASKHAVIGLTKSAAIEFGKQGIVRDRPQSAGRWRFHGTMMRHRGRRIKTMSQTKQERNKALVLEAFDTLFNKRDYVAAERYWSPTYIQHSAHIAPGREGLFNLIKSMPPTLKYEPGMIVADGDLVIVHGRLSGFGAPVNWILADILRIEDGVLVEHWDVIQDEATEAQSRSGKPMFGDSFPVYNKKGANT